MPFEQTIDGRTLADKKNKRCRITIRHPLISMARPEGLEPPTYGFEDRILRVS